MLGTGVASNYNNVYVQQQDVTRGDARLDHTVNSKNSLFFRYSIFDAFTALPPLFGPQATGDTPSRAGKGDSRNQSMVLGDVHIFSGNSDQRIPRVVCANRQLVRRLRLRDECRGGHRHPEHQCVRRDVERPAAHRNHAG